MEQRRPPIDSPEEELDFKDSRVYMANAEETDGAAFVVAPNGIYSGMMPHNLLPLGDELIDDEVQEQQERIQELEGKDTPPSLAVPLLLLKGSLFQGQEEIPSVWRGEEHMFALIFRNDKEKMGMIMNLMAHLLPADAVKMINTMIIMARETTKGTPSQVHQAFIDSMYVRQDGEILNTDGDHPEPSKEAYDMLFEQMTKKVKE